MNIEIQKLIRISGILIVMLSLTMVSVFADTTFTSSFDDTGLDTMPPTIEIINPTEGYFHFSGIRLFPTQLDIVADTMGFGGFRVRPVQVRVTDDVDAGEDISRLRIDVFSHNTEIVRSAASDIYETVLTEFDIVDLNNND